MRIHWRIYLPLTVLLICITGLVAVPYLNHLMYPEALSRNDVTRALTRAPRQAIGYAVFPVERRVDELDAPDHIQTEAAQDGKGSG